MLRHSTSILLQNTMNLSLPSSVPRDRHVRITIHVSIHNQVRFATVLNKLLLGQLKIRTKLLFYLHLFSDVLTFFVEICFLPNIIFLLSEELLLTFLARQAY